jgi:hypothetical protein
MKTLLTVCAISDGTIYNDYIARKVHKDERFEIMFADKERVYIGWTGDNGYADGIAIDYYQFLYYFTLEYNVPRHESVVEFIRDYYI